MALWPPPYRAGQYRQQEETGKTEDATLRLDAKAGAINALANLCLRRPMEGLPHQARADMGERAQERQRRSGHCQEQAPTGYQDTVKFA